MTDLYRGSSNCLHDCGDIDAKTESITHPVDWIVNVTPQ